MVLPFPHPKQRSQVSTMVACFTSPDFDSSKVPLQDSPQVFTSLVRTANSSDLLLTCLLSVLAPSSGKWTWGGEAADARATPRLGRSELHIPNPLRVLV